jgi:molybdopterin synthase sulfurtransferase
MHQPKNGVLHQRLAAPASAIPAISTLELRQRLNDDHAIIVDLRPLPAYNGWRLANETRGGHLPGAVAFPSEWLTSLEDTELHRLLRSKGIGTGREVVVYGYLDQEIDQFAARVPTLGPIRRYAGGWAEWASDSNLPLERLRHYQELVHPQWLARLLEGDRSEAAPRQPFLLFHVNFGLPEEYEEDHLPQALYLDTNWLERESDWNRRSPAGLEAALCHLGITHDTTVVLYGRDTEGHAEDKWPGRWAGQIAACRAALILRYAGVTDVRVLDGGYDAWVRAGYGLETLPRQPKSVREFGASIPRRPELLIDIAEAKQIIADRDHAALVSIRSWKENAGRVSGYNYIAPKGRIAGDVWGDCGTDAYHMQHYRNVDNTMRPYPEIAANWLAAGITPDKSIAFYCGTGWRASETWFYAYLMGWPRVSVYDGGWFEWSKDPVNNPTHFGDDEVDVDENAEGVA